MRPSHLRCANLIGEPRPAERGLTLRLMSISLIGCIACPPLPNPAYNDHQCARENLAGYGGAPVSATRTSWVPRGANQSHRLRLSTRRTCASIITPRSSGAASVVTSSGPGNNSASAICSTTRATARDASDPPTTPSWVALLRYRGESAIVRRATGARAWAASPSEPRRRLRRPSGLSSRRARPLRDRRARQPSWGGPS
jgi:hypothetical protein